MTTGFRVVERLDPDTGLEAQSSPLTLNTLDQQPFYQCNSILIVLFNLNLNTNAHKHSHASKNQKERKDSKDFR